MEYEVEGPRQKGRPKRTWREVVERECQAGFLPKIASSPVICAVMSESGTVISESGRSDLFTMKT